MINYLTDCSFLSHSSCNAIWNICWIGVHAMVLNILFLPVLDYGGAKAICGGKLLINSIASFIVRFLMSSFVCCLELF